MHLGRVANRAVLVLVAGAISLGAPQAWAQPKAGLAPGEGAGWSIPPSPDPSPPVVSEGLAWPWPPPKPAPKFECVAHELEPAAGLPGMWYAVLGFSGIDGAGNVLFWAYLDGPGVSPANDMALFYGPPGAAQLLVWESQPAPDMPSGVVISSL